MVIEETGRAAERSGPGNCELNNRETAPRLVRDNVYRRYRKENTTQR